MLYRYIYICIAVPMSIHTHLDMHISHASFVQARRRMSQLVWSHHTQHKMQFFLLQSLGAQVQALQKRVPVHNQDIRSMKPIISIKNQSLLVKGSCDIMALTSQCTRTGWSAKKKTFCCKQFQKLGFKSMQFRFLWKGNMWRKSVVPCDLTGSYRSQMYHIFRVWYSNLVQNVQNTM